MERRDAPRIVLEEALERTRIVADHHAPDCPRCHGAPASDGGVDLFCDCHKNSEPEILADRESIAWPAGWTQEDADDWRSRHTLPRPQTWLEERMESGDVRLVTRDPEMAARVARAKEGAVQTFVYWTGEDQAIVVGLVHEACEEGRLFRFTVSPEAPGAHAI